MCFDGACSHRAARAAALGGLLATACIAVAACNSAAPAMSEGGAAAPPAADSGGRVAQNARRRRRGTPARSSTPGSSDTPTSAPRESAVDPGRATADDLALGGDPPAQDRAAPARAIPTETGPMLPENDDRPSHSEIDLGAAGGGPTGLSPSDVSHAMEPLLGRLQNCAAASSQDGASPHGRVTVGLRVRSTGAPSAARVTAAGADARFVTCVRRVVASAHFPSFHGTDAVSATWGFDVD